MSVRFGTSGPFVGIGLRNRRHPPPPTDGTTDPGTTPTGVLTATVTGTQQSLLDALAPLVGMSTDELKASLDSGQKIEDLAAAYGIDLAALSAQLETTTGLLIDVKG